VRSLWRMIASRWLGGQGSEALTADSALLDLLMLGERAGTRPGFEVRRQSEVSHRAMMSPQDQKPATLEPVPDEKSRNDSSA
jgi:hypothetical protein